MAITASILFIVSMTFERFYSIIRPHKAASFNTVKRAKITIIVVGPFSVLFNIPHFFITSNQGSVCLPFGDEVAMGTPQIRFFFWLSSTVIFVIPFVLLLTMNSGIIHTLRRRPDLALSKIESKVRTDDKRRKSNDKQIYSILLLVTFAFLILCSPLYIFTILHYSMLDNFLQTPKAFAAYNLLFNVAQKLSVTNYGINFFLYVISGKKFRTDLVNAFRIKNAKRNQT